MTSQTRSKSSSEEAIRLLSAIPSHPTVELIDDGYALCEQQSLNIVLCNAVFRKWFDCHELHRPLDQILDTLKKEILFKRLAKRGAYSFSIESEIQQRRRPGLMEVSFKPITLNDETYLSVHVRNMTKLKEKDALIASHSRMIEQSNRQLKRLTRQLEADNQRLGAEVEITRRLQQMLVPTAEELLRIEGLDIACFMEPADEVGGDYYDVLQYNGSVRIGIGDVTGHGLQSGVVMLMVQMGIRTLLAGDEIDARRLLSVLNRAVYDNVERMKADKSLSLTLLDYRDGTVNISGQHEEVIVVRKGGAVETLDTMDLGFPIGLDADIAGFINEMTIELEAGDGIVLYTDGITEAENLAQQQYGLERLCAVISRHWSEPAEGVREAITDAVFHYIGEQTVFDDITVVVMKQK